MSDSKNDADMIRRLEHLERQIKEHDDTQGALLWISLTGITAILIVLFIFLGRLYSYGINYDYQPLLQQIAAEAESVVRPEWDILRRELMEEILPDFSKKLTAEFNEAMPDIKDRAMQLGDQLGHQIKQRAEERILETLIASLEENADEIREIFPEFSAEDLERQIGNSMGYYVEKLHDVIEERLALVAASLEGLKGAVDGLQKAESMKEMVPKSRTIAEEQLIDALLELVVYEIREDLGNQKLK